MKIKAKTIAAAAAKIHKQIADRNFGYSKLKPVVQAAGFGVNLNDYIKIIGYY